MDKVKIAVHKFASCDGCQLGFLNLGEKLVALTERLEIVHFAEAGPFNPDEKVAVSFVEGSITTEEDIERIKWVRKNSGLVVAIGACATSGGLQALKNTHQVSQWIELIYASPEYIRTLETALPISDYIKVDYELWGCPINKQQLLDFIEPLLLGLSPQSTMEKLCLDCKRQAKTCVVVTQNQACMGAVTKSGCGVLCPAFGRGCYGCFGPSEQVESSAMIDLLTRQGLDENSIKKRFAHINSAAPEFERAVQKIKEQGHG